MSERYIVTSALPYINGIKHLGNLVGSILPADIYTRYLKLLGKDVIYICGTDDHGTPAELSAMEASKPVDEYCNEMYEIQKNIYEEFNINFDYFGRTSDIENHEITQEIFLNLFNSGYINENKSIQLYSVEDKRYLPDRYVLGTCPNCGYERARGDQCENCTKLLDPTDLIDPRSAISGSKKIEKREVRHLYINLPKLQPQVEEWIEKQHHWPATSLSIAKKWLKEGLKERAITRNLEWGIKVPLEGYDDVKFYVWFDAPIGYISITKKWAKLINKPEYFEKYWKSKDTKLIQFMGIDNVPFHALTFPASIIGSNLGYRLVHTLKGFQWLTFERGKFSTSENRGIFTDVALKLYPADYWRYYLTLIAPEKQDTDFQWRGFQSAVNNDLNNLLGNLLNRFLTFSKKYFDGKIPSGKIGKNEKVLQKQLKEFLAEYHSTFDNIQFQKPVKALRKFWQDCNKYFQICEPWNTIKTDPDKTATTISMIAHALRVIAITFYPIAPNTSEKIFSILGYDSKAIGNIHWEDIDNWTCLVGRKIKPIEGNLFKKISDKDLKQLEKKYGYSVTRVNQSSDEDKKEKRDTKSLDLIEYQDFDKIKLITAIIIEVNKHPKADKLLVLTVDDGKRNDRTICAGIAKHYTQDELVGKTIIIVDNLKPRKLRGVKSEGMLLAAEDETGVILIKPSKQVRPGLRIQ